VTIIQLVSRWILPATFTSRIPMPLSSAGFQLTGRFQHAVSR
jgi:hypothetical protein